MSAATAVAGATNTAAPQTTEAPTVVKGLGQVNFSWLPKGVKKVLNNIRKQIGKDKYTGKAPIWIFYTEQPLPGVATPGFVAFHDAPHLPEPKTYKELRAAGPLMLEVTGQDAVDGVYSQMDWADTAWAAKRALGIKVGPKPSKPVVEKAPGERKRAWTVKYLSGHKVGLTRKTKTGLQGVQFLEGEYEGGKAQVPEDCLAEDAESSLKIEVPAYEISRAKTKVEAQKYEPRFADIDFDALETAPVVAGTPVAQ